MGSRRRAVVVGAGIAGLLAARVLADTYDEVVVLDRDHLPEDPVPRAGVPQGRHVHGLLARGREAMEELLPGLTAELVAHGATCSDFQSSSRMHVEGRPLAVGASGLLTLAVSRPLLEWQVRRRVAAVPNVGIRERAAVLDLGVGGEPSTTRGPAVPLGAALPLPDDDRSPRVAGVNVSWLDRTGAAATIDADLVVDASGRMSRTCEWLQRRDLPVAGEEHVRVDVCYATRVFRRRPEDLDGLSALLATSDPVTARSGILLAQEGERWIAGLTGYHGERPPTDLIGFLAWADTLVAPLGPALRALEPLDNRAATHRFPSSVRRRYERVGRPPDGLVVLGDALCAFNPAYGQGMAVAAAEALELRSCLAAGDDDLARRFFRRAARVVDTPWTLVVGRDRQLLASTEPVPVATRLANRYLRALLRAATSDPELARRFLRVQHLVARPPTLMTPGTVARVARGVLRGTGRRSVDERLSPDAARGGASSTSDRTSSG
ncbi:MAG: FAD-dependent oxidoreductase [Phycicoccus sp.]